jgi:phosphoserine phosphatase
LVSSAQAEKARTSLRLADAVCFDVDSTVITNEGIDILAAFKGVGDQVSELTRRFVMSSSNMCATYGSQCTACIVSRAMGGSVLFQDAFRDRLDIIRPSRADFESCIRAHPVALSPRVRDVVARLHRRGTPVFLVSGGMREVVVTNFNRFIGIS